MWHTRSVIALAALALPLLAATVARSVDAPPPGEYGTERPGGAGDDPIDTPRDLTGRSVKTPRVRLSHTTDPSLAGGSAYFMQRDPWCGYQRGRELFLREFSAADGVFGEAGKLKGPALDDGVTRQASGDHVNSCATCHNVPWRDAGAGATIAKNGGLGRSTPHLFGAGLLEMLAWQIRLDLMAQADRDRNGWISLAEARGVRALVSNLPPTATPNPKPDRALDFGRFDDRNGDGKPDLNEVVFPVYVDAAGRRIPWARSLKVPGVAGYTVIVQPFGFGHRARLPITSTLRAFSAQAWDVHAGMQAHDPTLDEEMGAGLARVSLAGAPQFVTDDPRDRGQRRDARGISLDDPDRDGHMEEITEGDLDLIEWYQLNHPRPARGPRTAVVTRGEVLFARIGCAGCHTPDWRLNAADPRNPDYTRRYTGDRRFFDLETRTDANGELVGRLRLLADRRGQDWLPRRGAFTLRGVYTDLRYHDLGPACRQMQYDGSTLTRFRTPPLWGVASTAPYGHDGSALTLETVIRRHGGEADAVTGRYRALGRPDQEALLAFLNSLVLYSTEDLPTDLDGDGKIAAHFRVAGRDTGPERFNPEWLFHIPAQIEGPVTAPDGRRVVSQALVNRRQAYGLDLPLCRDRDRDGFPDALGALP
jgi:hypothetical protein